MAFCLIITYSLGIDGMGKCIEFFNNLNTIISAHFAFYLVRKRSSKVCYSSNFSRLLEHKEDICISVIQFDRVYTTFSISTGCETFGHRVYGFT